MNCCIELYVEKKFVSLKWNRIWNIQWLSTTLFSPIDFYLFKFICSKNLLVLRSIDSMIPCIYLCFVLNASCTMRRRTVGDTTQISFHSENVYFEEGNKFHRVCQQQLLPAYIFFLFHNTIKCARVDKHYQLFTFLMPTYTSICESFAKNQHKEYKHIDCNLLANISAYVMPCHISVWTRSEETMRKRIAHSSVRLCDNRHSGRSNPSSNLLIQNYCSIKCKFCQ